MMRMSVMLLILYGKHRRRSNKQMCFRNAPIGEYIDSAINIAIANILRIDKLCSVLQGLGVWGFQKFLASQIT